MRKSFSRIALCCSGLCLGLFVQDALAVQTISIVGKTITGAVYGNGSQPDGASSIPKPDLPTDLSDPNGNTVNIINSHVDGSGNSVYGSYATDDNGPATATGNTVNISGSTAEWFVYGAALYSASAEATATDNSVNIIGSSTVGSVYGGSAGGYYTVSATATGNSVNIANSTASDVTGGYAGGLEAVSATATGNIINITNSTVSRVIGGETIIFYYNGSATAAGNTVNIIDSNVDRLVAGGSACVNVSSNAAATDNRVNIRGGSAFQVAGGYATPTVINNSVSITGDAVVNDAYGGHSAAALEVMGNSLTITDNAVLTNIAVGGLALNSYEDTLGYPIDVEPGDWIDNSGVYLKVTDNRLTVSGNAVVGSQRSGTTLIAGAYAATLNSGTINASILVSGNRLTIADDAVVNAYLGNAYHHSPAGVFGGIAESFDASAIAIGNIVSIEDNANVNNIGDNAGGGDVYGGYARGGTTVSAAENSVNISSRAFVGHAVYGGFASTSNVLVDSNNFNTIFGTATAASVTGNSVIVSDGSMDSVYGGFGTNVSTFYGASFGTVSVMGNSLIVSGGTIDNAVGGASSGSGTATENSVIVSGGSVNEIKGGQADAGGLTGDVVAAENSVIVSGGYVSGNIYGGYATGTTGTAASTGNTVIISGGTINGDVFGGYAASTKGTAIATGNTVIISGNIKLSDVAISGGATGAGRTRALPGAADTFSGNTLNIWNYTGGTVKSLANFEHYDFIIPADQQGAVLTVIDPIVMGDGAGKPSTVSVSTVGQAGPLEIGATKTLIAGTITGDVSMSVKGQHGETLEYVWSLDQNSQGLIMQLAAIEASPTSKNLSEAFISGLALLGQGADLLAGPGLKQAANVAMNAAGFGSFAMLSGGQSRYNTGSHIDISSLSLVSGLSWGRGFEAESFLSRLTFGAFFEYGNGSYDTYNSFAGAASHGEGSANYMGGGLLTRLDFTGTASGRWYADASFRMGELENELKKSGSAGNNVKFDSESGYYGLHLGGGYIADLTDKASLDMYGKYFWSHQEGDSIRLASGDPVNFADADSHRLRLGTRLNYAADDYAKPYVGLAYEYEFAGKADAESYGYKIDAPELRGDTVMAEVGLNITPSPDVPFSFDLGVQGYVGQREGLSGNLVFRMDF